MRMRGGLTERKMKNKRYRRTEKAILIALFSFRHFPSMGMIAKRARIAKSTAYRHHNNSYEILTDFEDYLVARYWRETRILMRIRRVRLISLFRQMLAVLAFHREELEILLGGGWDRVIEKLVTELKPKIIERLKISDKQSDILVKEITGVIEQWGRKGFCEEEIAMNVEKIKYLITTARERLGPLEKI